MGSRLGFIIEKLEFALFANVWRDPSYGHSKKVKYANFSIIGPTLVGI